MIYLTHKMYMYSSTAGLLFANCLYMIVVFSIHIHRADGLSCYQCDSPDSIKNCPVVTCQQNEKCFVGSHQSSSGEKSYVYRCEAKLCNDQSVALIGRAVENATQPLEGAHCCDKDLCNGNVTECRDDPNIDCRALKDVVCPSLETASKLCRRTCNLCGSTPELLTATTSVQVSTTPLTTTQQKTTTKQATTQATTTVPVHVVNTTPGSMAVTPTTASFWLPWSPYNCETVDGVCFGIRRRVCSTDVTLYDCPGLDYDSELCSDSLCHVTCEDEPGFNCDRIKDIACIDSDLVSMCNRTCGVCDTGEITTVTTTTTTKTTTTAGTTTTQNSGQVTTGCQDLTGFNCEPIKDIVCNDPDLIHRCNKTCGVCDTGEATTKTTTTAGRTTTQPSGQVTTGCQDLPGFNCEPIKDIVCNDPDLIHRCNKTCGVCDTGEATTKTTAAAGRTTTQPSGQVTTGCQDLPGFNCEPIKDVVCNDPDLIHRCNKTCGVCGTCVDSWNCADPDIASLVCADPALAGRYCARTCKLC